jgi:hypothetical protein
MYKDCKVKISIGKDDREIEYGTGVQQGNNMAPILFLFVMLAVMETLDLTGTTKPEFRYFPQSDKPLKQRGRLLGQPTKSNGSSFNIENLLYVDDGAFLFQSHSDIQTGAQKIHDHFAHFGLQMHVGNASTKSKTEAMFFPTTLQEAESSITCPGDLILNNGTNKIHFSKKFRYLGATITPEINENAEVEIRIKKASSQMGILRHFFNGKDIDHRVKYWVYLAGPLNCLLWGCESWNLTERNKEKLRAFHHSAIRRILDITWTRVREEKITNEEIRHRFCQILEIDTFIIRRTARYVGKIYRSDDQMLPKKLLGAWIHGPRKIGKPQLSCNNNFLTAIQACLPELSEIDDQGLFKIWGKAASDEEAWNCRIEDYFVSCQSEIYDDTEQDTITQRAVMRMQNLRFDDSNT